MVETTSPLLLVVAFRIPGVLLPTTQQQPLGWSITFLTPARKTSHSLRFSFSILCKQVTTRVWAPFLLRERIKTRDLRAFQSEERKSFKPPFLLLPWLFSRMRILLKRWTTQFLGLEGGLEDDDEPEPGVLEEIEALKENGERDVTRVKIELHDILLVGRKS